MKLADFFIDMTTETFRFRPTDGVFRARIVEILTGNESEEFADLFSESCSDILAGICGTSVADGIIRCRVYCDAGERDLECALAALSPEELLDLTEQLANLDGTQSATDFPPELKSVVRRQSVDTLLSIDEAARQLNVSKQLLKSHIPCTDYTYTEIDGKIDIEEYFWSPTLVARLSNLKKSGATDADISYIAEECCHGDSDWAREIIGLFTKPVAQQQREQPTQNINKKEPARTAPSRNSNHRYRGKKPA